MIKLKDILKEAINIYSVDVTIITDSDANFTDILDGMRATRKVTIINANTSDDLELKNRKRTDGKAVRTATLKFTASQDPKQDLEFLKTTMLRSEAAAEKTALIDELKLMLEESSRNKYLERQANEAQNVQDTFTKFPYPIYVA